VDRRTVLTSLGLLSAGVITLDSSEAQSALTPNHISNLLQQLGIVPGQAFDTPVGRFRLDRIHVESKQTGLFNISFSVKPA
jgi:hypothetical protein